MAKTITSLFARPKSLNTILGSFAKIASDLDEFVLEADSDIVGLTEEIGRLDDSRGVAVKEKAQAIRARAKIADFLGA